MGRINGSPVRERLLAAADELFYSEGVQTVGIDRITKCAGASKKSLYDVFGSKEALVLAYLDTRRASIQHYITQGLSRFGTPRERLLGVFESQGELFAAPDYNGCPLLSASAEAAAGSPVERAYVSYRTWVRALFTELAAEAGVSDPEAVGRELHLLFDAASVAAKADRDPSAAVTARTAAAAVLECGMRRGSEGRGRAPAAATEGAS
jgi:AcrR family transcriptional regulator